MNYILSHDNSQTVEEVISKNRYGIRKLQAKFLQSEYEKQQSAKQALAHNLCTFFNCSVKGVLKVADQALGKAIKLGDMGEIYLLTNDQESLNRQLIRLILVVQVQSFGEINMEEADIRAVVKAEIQDVMQAQIAEINAAIKTQILNAMESQKAAIQDAIKMGIREAMYARKAADQATSQATKQNSMQINGSWSGIFGKIKQLFGKSQSNQSSLQSSSSLKLTQSSNSKATYENSEQRGKQRPRQQEQQWLIQGMHDKKSK